MDTASARGDSGPEDRVVVMEPEDGERPPSRQPTAAHSGPLPAPYQLAIEDIAFQLTVLDDRGARGYAVGEPLIPPMWFSVAPTTATAKRYLYLVQKETATRLVVLILLYDRQSDPSKPDAGDAGSTRALRLPPGGAWIRAVVDGTVHVMASDLVLTRKSITAWIGGSEPPTLPVRPPYT
jgi:hypothetical protein